jgi:mono/diheme cytochrome c family protein
VLVVLGALAAGGALAYAMRYSEIPRIPPPAAASFDRALVARGEELAGIGNCAVCHTRPGGRPYAGGLPLETPFGLIYTTNITPDPETGIGAWSEQAFFRAMREGVDREGRYLYPAFPYDYFAKTTDEDLKAIYAYLMTRPAVAGDTPANELGFPFNIRVLMAGWNFLFLDGRPFQPDPAKDEEWNRGAYLVEGLGHCGACHSSRNIFGAARKGPDAYDGGYPEGWYAPPLNRNTPAPVPWTDNALVNYLIDGWDRQHGIAAGPMIPIVNDLYNQDEDDVFAMATYLMSIKGGALPQAEQEAKTAEARAFADRMEWGHPENPPLPSDATLQAGARVFERECVTCHKTAGQPTPLGLSTVVNAPDAANLVRIVYMGIEAPPRGALDRRMPARAIQISDQEMTALAVFVRARFSRLPAWQGVADAVRDARHDVEARRPSTTPAPGAAPAPGTATAPGPLPAPAAAPAR